MCSLPFLTRSKLDNMYSLDAVDRRILALFHESPDVGVLGASRRLGVARGTVQGRLDRLVEAGVIRTWAPTIEPAAMGFGVTAFVTLEIRQGRGHEPVAAHLRAIPEVLEAHTITGPGDLWVRVVARDNGDLQRVLDRVLDDAHIVRASSVISLGEQVGYRTDALVARGWWGRGADG